uniref:Uncharacterized protein At4g00950 n=1 Tax=Nicotiana tabacum TaxID=4097 RepID=A0A1S3Y7T3_TOBAC|nr:PREDICTED: uncharacterized protein At4g00950-like [Nicotiana tabacum]
MASNSTPKLSLSKLPNKPRNNNIPLSTPPIHPSVSIPFQWEEAPGKPIRSTLDQSKVARCLDLPPRLLNEGKITNTASPTTVLDGPYIGRSFSSFRSAYVGEMEVQKKLDMSNNKDMRLCQIGSCRWESFEENRGGVVKDNFDFSGPLSSTSSTAYDFDTHEKKLLRFRRKGSFLSFSRTNSNLLGGIYENFKQAIPWRWRRAKTQRAL